MFANLITIPADDTGYTLHSLLVTAGAQLPQTGRVAVLKISPISSTALAFLVPSPGAYSAAVNVPAQYGWDFSENGTWFESAYPQNWISLYEIIVGGNGGEKLAVWGTTI